MAVRGESEDGQRLRFQIELEFVQCLANPNYLLYTLCAFISWTFCSTRTSGRRLSTASAPNSLTTRPCYTGSTTQGSV
ncbi:uncharacterized protein LOC119575432 isoform X2 [Penaeus monodon]|uniref:uncharacterized protein LOC119575432 isoform X2 n=1 Tax=Penaeus monodon TaxID=6687 RepID=UPI0018A78797|nr:uncharacterized protein LOC119575432 isoform X2 [Penaeus monodon]